MGEVDLFYSFLKSSLFLGVLLAGFLYMKRRGVSKHHEGRELRVLERVSLGPKVMVTLLECQGEQYLIGQSDGGVTLLEKRTP